VCFPSWWINISYRPCNRTKSMCFLQWK
jgi:hypothetical protein